MVPGLGGLPLRGAPPLLYLIHISACHRAARSAGARAVLAKSIKGDHHRDTSLQSLETDERFIPT